MPVFGTQMFGSGGATYEIGNSCVFDSASTASMSRTPGSAGNQKILTQSIWVKRGKLGTDQTLGVNVSGGVSTGLGVWFNADDTMSVYVLLDTTWVGKLTTTQVFRDPSAWYHVVFSVDTPQATASNRIKLYINGSQVTAFSVDDYPDQDTTTQFNNTVTHYIGRYASSASYWADMYQAEHHWIDGTALTPSSFGETNDEGVWVPKKYSGSYGTTGFYLDYADSSDLGDDESGQGNDWAESNLTASDQRTDTPTNNQVTFNPLNNQQSGADAITEGNTVYNGPSTRTMISLTANLPPTGKWAVAFSASVVSTGAGWNFGITKSNNSNFGDAAGSNEDVGASDGVNMSPSSSDLQLYDYITSTSIDPTLPITTSDEFWLAVDMATGKCFLGISNQSDSNAMIWVANDAGVDGNPATGDNPTCTISAMIGSTDYTFAAAGSKGNSNLTLKKSADLNGTIPSGYTYFENISDFPAPTLKDPSTNYQAQLYTGNDSTQSITFGGNSDMQPDIVALKDRESTYVPNIYDAARGVQKYLQMDNTAVEATDSSTLTAFNSDGFSLGSAAWVNGSNDFVSWNWSAGNSGSSNTAGTINTTTTYSDATAGISVSTFEGNGTAGQTVGHGLGVKPDVIIIKNRDNTEQWIVYHTAQGATKYALLNDGAAFADSDGAWNDVEPTSTLVTLGGGGFGTNVSGNSMIMYAFAEVAGFSKFSVFTGNSNANGPFIYTGFKPRWYVQKGNASGHSWCIIDRARTTYNGATSTGLLFFDSNSAEYFESNHEWDFLSNGIKLRGIGNNNSSYEYVVMAFAENPFGGDGVAPATAI